MRRPGLGFAVVIAFAATQCSSEIGFAPDKTPKQTESQAPPRVFLLDGKHLQAVRQRIGDGDQSLAPALAGLKRDAQRALEAGAFSVVLKDATPPSGDKHDYMSQAPYFWPNPETTNGLPYIRRDGERNPEINKFPDHRVMDEMVDAVETLALAYYLDGNKACASKAAELLRTWFLDPATRMSPHLQYAQAIPGINTGRGIGLIETRGLTRIGDAIGLLAGSNALTEADQQGLQEWFDKFLLWMRESRNGRDEAAAKNNHGTYYDVQVASFALFLGRQDLAREVLQMAKQKRIAVQIEPDGRQPWELARTKAWSYSIGNLQGLILLARLGENVRVDLWNFETADGRSIRKAFDYLVSFAGGDEKWPHRQLGGFSPRALGPVVRRMAGKFPNDRYRALLVKFPDEDPASRAHLLRPGVAEKGPAVE
jgi:hypothetical protein